jgi:hypothetical protein
MIDKDDYLREVEKIVAELPSEESLVRMAEEYLPFDWWSEFDEDRELRAY